MIAVTLVAAACVLVSVTVRLLDMDVWQHLTYGRALWALGRVPTAQMWTWPTYGEPEVNASWGFRALLWPFWRAGELGGLYAFRWLLALATFGFMWATARRLGARGLPALVVLVLASLAYRQRAQIRPELFAGLLLAAAFWILESRRQGGPDRSPWLIAIAWVWANSHLSYFFGLLLLGLYVLETEWRARREPGVERRRLWFAALGALAVSFVNPFGLRALAWPFQFMLAWRLEPLERDVAELAPLLWGEVWRAGVPLLVVGWPLLMVARARRRGLDPIEAVLCLAFTALAITGHRFVATYAIVAAPFVARALAESPFRFQRIWPATAWPRAAATAGACVAVCLGEWFNPILRTGFGYDMNQLPVQACDFVERNGIRGRTMNHYVQGGYIAWRFWPDRERLPFFTIHTEYGTPELRARYFNAFFSRRGWLALDDLYRFDYALLRYRQAGDDRLLDILDADTSWALVFVDDAAAVYVRRQGPLAAAARRHGYRVLGAGSAALQRLDAALADSAVRVAMRRELERQAASSTADATAHTMLAYVALFESRGADARRHFEAALAADPQKLGARMGLGMVALAEGRPREALDQFAAERRLDPGTPGLAFETGRAWLALGDASQARRWFRVELERHPDNAQARDALATLELRRL